MELRAFIAIFIEHKKIFLWIVMGAVLCGIFYYFLQPQYYHVSLTLNVARTYPQQQKEDIGDDYSGFYRLQADERFADTVVRWLQSPRIVSDILSRAHISSPHRTLRGLQHTMTARRLSSQVIDVQFSVDSVEQGRDQADAIVHVLNDITHNLNDEHYRGQWFRIIAQDPVITSAQKPLSTIIIVALIIGSAWAFIAVVFVHYYKKEGQTS